MNQSTNRVHRDFKENGVKSKRQFFYKNRSPNEVVESKNTRPVLFIRLSNYFQLQETHYFVNCDIKVLKNIVNAVSSVEEKL